MKKIISFLLALCFIFTGCKNKPNLILYLSNVSKKNASAKFILDIDGKLFYSQYVSYSGISPSYEMVSAEIPKGVHKINLNVNKARGGLKFTLKKNIFIYASYYDSLGVQKISFIQSEKPFKHQ